MVIQLGTSTRNVLCKLQVKYNTVKVFILVCNLFNYNKKTLKSGQVLVRIFPSIWCDELTLDVIPSILHTTRMSDVCHCTGRYGNAEPT
jgi:hypothetical protein